MTLTNSTAKSAPPQQQIPVACMIENRLYFAVYDSTPKSDQDTVYISVEDSTHYDQFYDDFGPLNLSVLYRFCESLNNLINNTKKVIFVVTNRCPRNRVNAAFLVASYMVIYKGLSVDAAYLRVKSIEPQKFVGFRDAALGPPTYLLHVHDVIKSVEKAMQFKWLNFSGKSFDPDEYEFYERVENGDFNWIIPQKILSFCGPHDKSYTENGYPYHSPEVYFDYFRRNNITTIIRLNRKVYDAKRFTDAGFQHHDLFFIDGSTPSDEIVLKFIDAVDKAPGAVAVHCKAGLGRTGTLIACWMMKHFNITAPVCMAWLRVCRPGSVIGPQQQFLIDKEEWCRKLGEPKLPETEKDVPKNGYTKRSSRHLSPKGTKDSTDESEARPRPKVLVTGLVEKAANELDYCGIQDMKDGTVISSTVRGKPKTSQARTPALRTRRSIDNDVDNSNGYDSTLEQLDETAINEKGQSQGDRLCEMKAKTAVTKTSPTTYSSATTPIKQLRLSSSRARGMGLYGPNPFPKPQAHRYLNFNIPISRVTVSTNRPSILARSNPSKRYTGVRNTKPYSAATRSVDHTKLLENNNGIKHTSTQIGDYTERINACVSSDSKKYELRPRKALHLPSRFDPAVNLLPKSNALLSSPLNNSKMSPNSASRTLRLY
ncbi:dual specificity phosphatase, catalytic domain-containing protein [Ditylenchus destructor]|uniref:protein-tyrosine-phosphatase n=1 Tax=Ditylenchus destructor TaxID=166010 RepID=A0AAD4N9G1_9BILA|nr:dual specificity phosphatase, catalytic domain-containing protein [Ditylenchus destructor]